MEEKIKKLDNASLARLQALEREIGCGIIAYEPVPKLATLTQPQLQRLQAVERESKAVLLAYEC